MSRRKILLLLSATLTLIIACNINVDTGIPTAQPTADIVATSVVATLQAQQAAPPALNEPTSVPATNPTTPPTTTPSASTLAITPTLATPIASVSQDTNCRTGPGQEYEYLGALVVGEKAEIVGKRTSHDYWIIKNPDQNGECWLWGFHATVEGNTDNLPEYDIPAPPQPKLPKAPSNLNLARVCVAGPPPNFLATINLTWTDNSDDETLFLIYINNIAGGAVPANQTQDNFDIVITDGVPFTIGVSALNDVGESEAATIQVVCP